MLLLVAGLAVFAAPGRLSALPIKVSDKDAVQEMMRPHQPYIAARAGWYGPEADPQKRYNPTYERLSPQMTAWQLRSQIVRASVPDWRLALIVLITILCLRYLSKRMSDAAAANQPAEILEFPPAASTPSPAADDLKAA